jgi:hypothetical protein
MNLALHGRKMDQTPTLQFSWKEGRVPFTEKGTYI